MGLSIHYNGRFNKSASLPAMIEEVKDIVEVYKWKYFVFETEFPDKSLGKANYNDNIYGIIFSAPGCEPVYLSFLSNGRMSCSMNLEFWGKSTNKKEKSYLYMLSTKTQYAGMQTHLTIIQILKHLSKKYFSDFELFDESGYWETGDVNILAESFKRYNDLIEAVTGALKTYKAKDGESIEKYFERILKQIHIKRKNKNKNGK